jgi:hypothetical protein
MLIHKLHKKCRNSQTICDLINPILSCLVPTYSYQTLCFINKREINTNKVFYIERQHPNYNHNSPIYDLDFSLSARESFPKLNKKAKNRADT